MHVLYGPIGSRREGQTCALENWYTSSATILLFADQYASPLLVDLCTDIDRIEIVLDKKRIVNNIRI